jgi:hypothetical protein
MMRKRARRFHVPRAVLAAVILVGLVIPAAAAAQTSPTATKPSGNSVDVNLGAYVELLRSDVRSQKIAILTQLMEFTEAEDKAFWPVYREYDRELTTLADERVANIQEYAKNYPDVSDAVADKLMLKALDIDARRSTLLAKYYALMKSTLTPKTAAKFIQIEHQLLTIIDLQIAAALPVVQ